MLHKLLFTTPLHRHMRHSIRCGRQRKVREGGLSPPPMYAIRRSWFRTDRPPPKSPCPARTRISVQTVLYRRDRYGRYASGFSVGVPDHARCNSVRSLPLVSAGCPAITHDFLWRSGRSCAVGQAGNAPQISFCPFMLRPVWSSFSVGIPVLIAGITRSPSYLLSTGVRPSGSG